MDRNTLVIRTIKPVHRDPRFNTLAVEAPVVTVVDAKSEVSGSEAQ
jgi:hypothetical protein